MAETEGYIVGDAEIALYIPSRYRDGALIPTDVVEIQAAAGREALSRLFGGSTGVDPNQYIGSFRHDDDGRIVDEAISRVWTKVEKQILDQEEIKETVADIAKKLAKALDQESLAVEWGDQLVCYSTSERKRRLKKAPFVEFSPAFQRQMATIALMRVRSVERIVELLTLDLWEKTEPTAAVGAEWATLVAQKRGNRAAICKIKLTADARSALSSKLKEGDLVFTEPMPERIQVWMKCGGMLRGGRQLSVMSGETRVSRNKLSLCLSILGGKNVERLQDVIDREAVTSRFFQSYNGLAKRVENELAKQKLAPRDAALENQMLMGRLMFLRFLEQKGWLEGRQDYLAQRYRHKKGSFFSTVLFPFFNDVLDTPPEKRKSFKDLPHINAGLFRRNVGIQYELSDALFDPDRTDSLLGIMKGYDFTLDEFSGSDDIAVNPAMLGFVLESMCTDQERKTQGVHYTPPVIADALAQEGILGRLAELSDISLDKLRDFSQGSIDCLTINDTVRVQNLLFELRIIDPAVGSGSLLLAALEFLMRIYGQCCRRVGQPLIKGEYSWSEAMRRFIRECLYGVDIDPLAPEIAKLRLWLALAVGEKLPRPLPDLEHNLKCGDSLSAVDDVDEQAQLELEFDDLAKSRNAFLESLKQYRKAEGPEAREAADALAGAEYLYYINRLRAEGLNPSGSNATAIAKRPRVPFRWSVHFAEVFNRANRGFDLVIANPPYVRIQNLRQLEAPVFEDYEKRFKALSFGNKDIYLAFIEQALALAGKSGRIAFIIANFSRTASGAPLREILNARGSVDSWVDFGDIQIFESATNYVALLFATGKKRKRTTFLCHKPTPESWPPESGTDWLRESPSGRVSGSKGIWRTLTEKEAEFIKCLESKSICLGDIAKTIGVGVQTSADDVFLLSRVNDLPNKVMEVYSEYLGREIEIEVDILRACAKGSKHIRAYQVQGDIFMLWPYSRAHEPSDGQTLRNSYPLAWSYLEGCKKRLLARAIPKNRFSDRWWQFGRAQGLELCASPKILVPSILKGGTAYFDESGRVAYTASGKGGGGAWGIVLRERDIHPRWLLAVLNSKDISRWLSIEGDPKRDGWRGVDQALLKTLPVPKAKPRDIGRVVDLTREVEMKISKGQDWDLLQNEIDDIVSGAFRTR